MDYALWTLWFERRRYWAGVFAVAFAAVLMAVQVGLLEGLMSMVSYPVDASRSDIWVAAAKVPSCDLASPMKRDQINRLLVRPEVESVSEYIQGFSFWTNPSGGKVLIIVAGCDLNESTLGPANRLTADQRTQLTEIGTVFINIDDRKRLGVDKLGDAATVFGTQVRVVGFLHGVGSLTGPYVLCSLHTARKLLWMPEDETVFFLANCKSPTDAPGTVNDLNESGKVTAYQTNDFSYASRMYWITNTKAGVAIGFVALLGLTVGAVITSQTLYAATVASLRELAVLQALGAPRWRMNLFVLWQAFFVGAAGVLVGIPTMFAVAQIGAWMGTKPILEAWLISSTAAICLVMAMASGAIALRSLRGVEPANLLR